MNDLCNWHTVNSLLQGACACACLQNHNTPVYLQELSVYCKNSLQTQLSDQERADCAVKKGHPSGTGRQDEGTAYVKLVIVDYDWTLTVTQVIQNKTEDF